MPGVGQPLSGPTDAPACPIKYICLMPVRMDSARMVVSLIQDFGIALFCNCNLTRWPYFPS